MKYLLILTLLPSLLFANSHKPQDFLQSIQGKPDEGQQIIKHYCLSCHAKEPLINIGAPPVGDENAWQLRLDQGWDILVEKSSEGFNSMPARGGCFECSDKQFMLAILALLPEKAQIKYKHLIK